MEWKGESFEEIGGHGGMVFANALMRYIGGVIHRERERIAEVLQAGGVDEKIVSGVLDDSKDRNVFQFRPPDTKLNAPVVPSKPKTK